MRFEMPHENLICADYLRRRSVSALDAPRPVVASVLHIETSSVPNYLDHSKHRLSSHSAAIYLTCFGHAVTLLSSNSQQFHSVEKKGQRGRHTTSNQQRSHSRTQVVGLRDPHRLRQRLGREG